MSGQWDAVTRDHCPLCDGPCREPFLLPPATNSRPFAEVIPIPMSQPIRDQPEPEPAVEEPKPPSGKRSKRLAEDRARHPAEDR